MWAVFAASQPGTQHLAHDLPCQDAFALRQIGETVVVAVADGLGSAPQSDVGAARAADAAVWSLRLPAAFDDDSAWREALKAAFAAARADLEQFAQDQGAPLRDFATTLILAVAHPTGAAVAHIGDGGVVVRLADRSLTTISEPGRGEYANEVVPLTAGEALPQTRVAVFHGEVHGLAAFTDGLQRLALNLASGAPFGPFFHPFFDACALAGQDPSADLEDFLQSERVNARTDDDKTLVIAGWTAAASS